MEKEASATVYWPMLVANVEGDGDAQPRRNAAFALRTTRAGTSSLLNEIQSSVWSVESSLPLAEVHTLDYWYTRSMARTSFTLVMLAVAGGMALLLGIIGLYGVIAYSVSQRRREIGIRMALGAKHQELVGMFVRYALGLAGVGVVCGLAAAFALTRLMSSLLFNVKPTDV